MPGKIAKRMMPGSKSNPADRPVKANAHRRTGREGYKRGAHLTVQIDYQIIAGLPESSEQPERFRRRGPIPAKLRKLLAVKKHNA